MSKHRPPRNLMLREHQDYRDILLAGVRQFLLDYVMLSEDGVCDDLGGAEWRRVLSEWIAADFPADRIGFIKRRANVGPLADGEKMDAQDGPSSPDLPSS